MSDRAQMLANEFEQAVNEFIAVVEGLPEDQWRALCPNEERSIAVLTHHVASSIPFEMTVFRAIAMGRQPDTISRDDLATMNAQHASASEDCAKEETLTLLRRNADAASAEVRQLSDEQLGRSGSYISNITELWTVDQWIERVLVGHVRGHLESIRMALGYVSP